MDLIISHLKDGTTPTDKREMRLLRLKVARYIIYDDKLYHRDFSLPSLKCMDEEDAHYIL